MNETEKILDAYQQANEELRLELYLAYRELRAIFDKIDSIQSARVATPTGLSRFKMIRSCTHFRKRLTFLMESR